MMFRCARCDQVFKEFRYCCTKCDSVLLADYEERSWKPSGSGVWRYQSMIPVKMSISLSEGGTPMVRRRDVRNGVYLKVEGDNPTGSFKDRGSTVVISDAVNRRFKQVVVASTGNMGASIAAYSAYANIPARVFIPGDVPDEKVAQIRAYGVELVRTRSFSDATASMRRDAQEHGTYLASTGLNPYFIEGLKTVGFEIFEQIGEPDKIIVPTGSGGLITAIHKAFVEMKDLGVARKIPQMIAVQSCHVDPIVHAWRTGGEIVPKEGRTIATAIMVKSPYNGYTAIQAIKSSGGAAVSVTDDQIIEAVRELGKEGIFAEPSSAASLAALQEIDYERDEKVVLIITGSGLKDPMALLNEQGGNSRNP